MVKYHDLRSERREEIQPQGENYICKKSGPLFPLGDSDNKVETFVNYRDSEVIYFVLNVN